MCLINEETVSEDKITCLSSHNEIMPELSFKSGPL